MAGAYPDPPNNRIAYDIDGSYTFILHSGLDQTQNYSAEDLANLNSDKAQAGALPIGYGPGSPGSCYVGAVFPEPRTITHVYCGDTLGPNAYMPTESGNSRFYYSTDTTNGVDGTWIESMYQVYSHALPLAQYIRSGISVITPPWTNVRGVRYYRYSYSLYGGDRRHALQLWGDRPTDIQRLAIWDPTLDVESGGSTFEFGTIQRGSTYTKTFRVKNLSSTKQANGVVLSLNANGDYNPTFISQTTLAYDTGAFGATATVGDLAAGATSAICTVKMITSTTAALATASLRIVAQAASWT